MRAVIDTNVLLTGLLWHGPPHEVMEQIQTGALTLVSSPALIAELAAVIARPKFPDALARSNTSPEQMLTAIRLLAGIVEPPLLPGQVSRDPDDDAVLALAAATQPDLILSGDHDLLSLKAHAGIPIVTPAAALVILARRIHETPTRALAT